MDARLLTADSDELSLSHESLLLAWPRLAEWIEADLDSLRRHRQLTSAAQQWDTDGRDDDVLWRGLRLEDTQRWVEADSERAVDLNRTEREFLATSAHLENTRQADARRRVRRTRNLLFAVSLFAVLACVLAAVAGVARAKSDRAERSAANQRNLAQSRQLAIEATQLEDTDPALASQLALAGFRVAPTLEARSAVLDSLAVPTPTRILGQPGPTPVALSQDGSELAVGNAVTGAVQLLQRSSNQAVPVRAGTIPGDRHAQVFALAFAPHSAVLATGGQDPSIRLWDITKSSAPKLLGSPLSGVGDAAESVAFSPDGRLLAAGGGGNSVILWDVSDPARPIRETTLTGIPGVVQTIAFSPDGKVLAVGGEDGLLRRWQLSPTTAQVLPPLPGAPSTTTTVDSVAFSPDGSLLAAGSKDSVVRVWQVRPGQEPVLAVSPLTGFTNWVDAVAFAPDGRTLAAGGSDNKVITWAVGSWHPLQTFPHPGPVTGLAYLPDGSQLLTGSADGTARLWPIPGPVLPGAQDNVFALSFSNAGLLAVGTAKGDHAVRLWQLAHSASPVELGQAAPPPSAALTGAAALSPDSHLVAAGDKFGTVLVWDASTPTHPRLTATLTGLHSTVEWLTFSPNSRLLAIGSDDAVVALWDLTDARHPRLLSILHEPTGYVFGVAFAPDGRTLAAGGADDKVRVWDVSQPAHPRLVATLAAFESYVYSLAISPDGRLLAAGSADHSIQLWDITDPSRPRALGQKLTGPNNTVFSLAFSPQSTYLAAGSTDGTIRTWDLTRPVSPQPLAVLRAANSDVFVVSFSPDGSVLAGSGAGRDVHLWPTDSDKAVEMLCRHAGDPISSAEWAEYAHGLQYRPPCS